MIYDLWSIYKLVTVTWLLKQFSNFPAIKDLHADILLILLYNISCTEDDRFVYTRNQHVSPFATFTLLNLY